MIIFVRHAPQPDLAKRFQQIQDHVPAFKDIEKPKDKNLASHLLRQTLTIKTIGLVEATLQVFKGRLNTSIANPATPSPSTPNSELATLRARFLKGEFTEENLNNLIKIDAKIGTDANEEALSTRALNVKNQDIRGWMALRVLVSGKFDTQTLDIFLADTSVYLRPNVLSKLYPIEPNNKEQITYLLQLLEKQIASYSKTNGLLNLLATTHLTTVVDNKYITQQLVSRDWPTQDFFAKLYIKQNTNLESFTAFLVQASLAGKNNLLIENMDALKKYISDTHVDLLLKVASDPTQKGATASQKVLAKMGLTSLAEKSGFYHFRQSPLNTKNTCLSFY